MQEEIQCKAKWVAVHKEKLFSTLDSLLQTRFRLLTVWTSAVVSTYGFILLFVFTFKVGKSYENSVNHGSNTSHQTNDKINCHTYASFNLVFQLSLVELWRLTA